MKKVKIKVQNYVGLDHDKVSKNFSGDLTYIGDSVVKGNAGFVPAAVYKAANPDREKGHKDFMLIASLFDPNKMKTTLVVTGREELDLHKEFDGVLCTKCNTALYSLTRHNFHDCGCDNRTFVDGGLDYMCFGATNMDAVKIVKINILKGTVKIQRKNKT